MKTYELKEVFVLTETDDTTNEEKILFFGDDGSEYNRYYEIAKNGSSVLCIPLENGELFTIEGVCSFEEDDNDHYISFTKEEGEDGEEKEYLYLFDENIILALGSTRAGEFYLNDDGEKKLAVYTTDDGVVYFEYLDYFEEDDYIIFEVAPGKFRIFTDYDYNEPEEKEEEYLAVVTDEGPTIFYRLNGETYEEIARETTLKAYNNAYLIQNSMTNKYELYGFENGCKKLLYSGKVRTDFYNGIIIDDKQWNECSDDCTLLYYVPEVYEPEPEPEPEPTRQYQAEESRTQTKPEKTNKPAGNNGWPEDEDRYFGGGSQNQPKKKKWWQLW